MILILNGEKTDIRENLTVEGLLNHLEIEPARVAVEVNLKIIKKNDFHVCILKDGDKVEVVNFVGGG